MILKSTIKKHLNFTQYLLLFYGISLAAFEPPKDNTEKEFGQTMISKIILENYSEVKKETEPSSTANTEPISRAGLIIDTINNRTDPEHAKLLDGLYSLSGYRYHGKGIYVRENGLWTYCFSRHLCEGVDEKEALLYYEKIKKRQQASNS